MLRLGSFNKDVCKEYMNLGVKHFSVGWDVEIIYKWMKENGDKIKEELDKRF